MKIQKTISGFCLLILLNILTGSLFSQTPYYSLKLNITDTETKDYIYLIKEHVCKFDYKPVIRSGDYWFGKDTSTLNWKSLPDSMYNSLSCKKVTEVEGKNFKNGNQQMIWEHIFSLTITRQIADSKIDELVKYDTMIIVFPVLLKSFVTYIDLGAIEFNKGYYELIDEFVYDPNDWLKITLPKDHKWRGVDFEERKIKIDPRTFPK